MLYWALAGRVREHGYFRALQFLPYLTRNARYDRFAGRCIYFRYKLTSGGTNLNTIEELNLKNGSTPHLLFGIFTARRVCIARTMPWQDVCLFVRHTPVLCLNGYTYPQSFLFFLFTNG